MLYGNQTWSSVSISSLDGAAVHSVTTSFLCSDEAFDVRNGPHSSHKNFHHISHKPIAQGVDLILQWWKIDHWDFTVLLALDCYPTHVNVLALHLPLALQSSLRILQAI